MDRAEAELELAYRREAWRIEAMNAASRIVAGVYAGAESNPITGPRSYGEAAIDIAETIAKWLEGK